MKIPVWKIKALATRIEIALNSEIPTPDRFLSLEDHLKAVHGDEPLAQNLRIWMLAVTRKRKLSFERLLQSRREYVISYRSGRCSH